MGARKGPYFFIPLRLITAFNLPESLGFFFSLCHGKSFGLRICQAEARAPCRHFLDQKKVAKGCRCAGPLSGITPVAPEVRASLSPPRESDKERPGSPPDPRAGRQPSSGGVGPACRARSLVSVSLRFVNRWFKIYPLGARKGPHSFCTVALPSIFVPAESPG